MKIAALSLVALLASCQRNQALPSGSPQCPLDQPAPPLGPHGASAGALATGGLTVSVDGQPLSDTGTASLVVGEPSTVTIEGTGNWLGVLVRVPGGDIDIPSGLFREGSNCAAGVGSLTHTSNIPKQSVSFTLTMDAEGTGIGLDIDVLRESDTHFYSQFSLEVVAAEEETDPPTAAPQETTSEPTTSPTASPTSAPSLAPITALPTSDSPTSSPTLTTSDVPSAQPSQVPSVGPTMTMSEVPSVEPSGFPSVGPTTTSMPSIAPVTEMPSWTPTLAPSDAEVDDTMDPTASPDVSETATPTTDAPSGSFVLGTGWALTSSMLVLWFVVAV